MDEEKKEEVTEETAEKEEKEEKKDEETARKVIFSLCYVWGILFFLPLVMYKNDEEAKFHANQGLALLIVSVVGNAFFGIASAVFGLIPTVGGVLATIFGALAGVFSLAMLILGILGIVNVVNGVCKELPIVGRFKLLQ